MAGERATPEPRKRPRRSAKPLWLALVVVTLATAVVAGCANGNTMPGPSPTPIPTPTPFDGPLPGDPGLHAIPRTTTASVSLTGAGATFPNVLYSTWVDEYNGMNPGVRVNYQSVGSGAGIRGITERIVDFGATDGPMNDEQKAEAPGRILHIPAAMGAVVPAYHLQGVDVELQFSQQTIAAIFLGHIGRWDDERIVADNPGVDFPDRELRRR